MFKYTGELAGLHIDLTFAEGVNLFTGLSGEGKTFLFDSLLRTIALYKKLKYATLSYRNVPVSEEMIKTLRGYDIIALDNADLYLTASMLQFLKANNKIILVSLKGDDSMCIGANTCEITYEEDSLKVV
jgi:predicted ATP-dependent endonuclease of OLD family